MARQYLYDDGMLEPSIADPLAANAATTETLICDDSRRYILIPAYDARPGKIYVLEAGGLITTGASGTLIINVRIHTTTSATLGNSLGGSVTQTVPVSAPSGPWYMRILFEVRTTVAPGGNSTMMAHGFFLSNGIAATANSGLQCALGGGAAANFDYSVNNTINITKTLSVAGSWTTQYMDLGAKN